MWLGSNWKTNCIKNLNHWKRELLRLQLKKWGLPSWVPNKQMTLAGDNPRVESVVVNSEHKGLSDDLVRSNWYWNKCNNISKAFKLFILKNLNQNSFYLLVYSLSLVPVRQVSVVSRSCMTWCLLLSSLIFRFSVIRIAKYITSLSVS